MPSENIKFKDLSANFSRVEGFLDTSEIKNVFYSEQWCKFLNNTNHSSVFAYGVENDKEELVAVLMGALESNFFWPIEKLTRRAIIHGGPYVKNNDLNILRFLLENYNRTIKRKAIYSQFRNQRPFLSKEMAIFNKTGFYYEPHLDILHDLEVPVKMQFEKLHKGRRKNIRRAERAGVEFREVEDDNEFRISYGLVESTYKRIKLPMPDKTFFTVGFEKLTKKNILKTFVAISDEEIIGCRMVLCYGDVVYDWYAGASSKHLDKYPNDFLPWKVIEWGSLNGYKYFDFGGAGKPNVAYGVRDHKLKFGGNLVEFGRFEKVHNKLLMKIGEIGFKFYQLVK